MSSWRVPCRKLRAHLVSLGYRSWALSNPPPPNGCNQVHNGLCFADRDDIQTSSAAEFVTAEGAFSLGRPWFGIGTDAGYRTVAVTLMPLAHMCRHGGTGIAALTLGCVTVPETSLPGISCKVLVCVFVTTFVAWIVASCPALSKP